MPESVNYGIQQSGGVSQVGNQAVGPGAYAVGGRLSTSSADVDTLVRRLVEALDTHRDEVPEPARPTAVAVRDVLTVPDADPARVRGLLERLAVLAAPVAPITAAVTELLKVVHPG
ncbi:hypothetical protein [Micromonospora sp. NPDC023956]|uniref:hypothetical protein n=1 Tax=Micromonospora sp. NPDC023956 TaxID=3155722 RepID=UPI0033DBA8F3